MSNETARLQGKEDTSGTLATGIVGTQSAPLKRVGSGDDSNPGGGSGGDGNHPAAGSADRAQPPVETPKRKKRKRFWEYPSNIRVRARRRLTYKLQPGEPRASNHNSPLGRGAIRTMQEVADIMGIGKSRVHQLERRALWKIRQLGIRI